MGVTESLARMVVDTRFEDIPQTVVEHAKERMLDSFAVMVGGSAERCTQIAQDFVKAIGGEPICQVVAQPWRTSPPNAAFVNGVASHALDYDETSQMVSHITPPAFPAILAAADMVKRSGKELLTAYIVAFELHARIGWGTMPVKDLHLLGWHPVPVVGAFSATAGAAKILGLDLEASRRALGIAGSETGGIRKNVGTMTKPFHAGNAARNGVVAAMLAARGYTANLDIFEGVPDSIGHDHFGFCETFSGPGNYKLEAMVEGIGQRWELDQPRTVTTKRHPGATYRAVPIDITIDMVAKHDIRPDQVERVEVGVGTMARAVSCYPRPQNGLDARYSLWYDVAISVLERRAGLYEYTDARVQQPDVQDFLERVHIYIDPEMDQLKKTGPSVVTMRLKDGRVLREHRTYTKGYPEDPYTWDDLVEKYLECAEYGRLAHKGVDPQRLIGLVQDIEKVPEASTLLKALAPA